jgi:hypothetical protein
MNPELNLIRSNTKRNELRREAAVSRRRPAPAERTSAAGDETVVRLAGPEDAVALTELADLEGRALPGGDMLVATRSDRVLAALPVGSGPVLADPSRSTLAPVVLLHRERNQLRGPNAPGRMGALGEALGRLLRPTPAGR